MLYMTLHRHKVDDSTTVEDGKQPVHVPAGWQIADGNADDCRVCRAHPWQSHCLVFANGDVCGTAACGDPYYIGNAQLLFSRKIYKKTRNPESIKTEIRYKSAQRRQPCTGREGGENGG